LSCPLDLSCHLEPPTQAPRHHRFYWGTGPSGGITLPFTQPPE
jgi:hypothetical protein